MTCEPTWIRASSQGTSFPFIQIFSEFGKDIRKDPPYSPALATPATGRLDGKTCTRHSETPTHDASF